MNIENKRIVITGATSGIGLHLLKVISAMNGTRIVASGRKVENIPSGENIFSFQADISQEREVEALFDFALEKLGGIDLFFANAGFSYYEKLGAASWNHVENIFAANVISPLYAVTKMIALNPSNEFMVIITCSVVGRLPFPGLSLYTGTKFALDGFSRAMHYEIPDNGHLALVYPVATYTEFFNRAAPKSNMPWPRQQTSDVVKAVLKGISKNKKQIYPFPLIRPALYLVNVFPFIYKIYHHIQKQKLYQLLNNKDQG
jgi:short-subunit dehydrogenase